MREPGFLGGPLMQLTLMRVRDFFREPEALFWALIVPVFLVGVLGFAFREAPPPVFPVATTTQDLADALHREKQLTVRRLTRADTEDALRLGQIVLVVEPGSAVGVIYRFDPANPEARTARLLADRALQQAAGRVDPVAAQDAPLTEAGVRYIDFLLPGLLGMTVLNSAVWGVTFNVVDSRRRKLMKRLIATPMPRWAYLLSLVLYRLVLLIVEAGAILIFGVLLFGVPLHGSFVALGLICLLTSLASSALGLLLASRVRTLDAANVMTNVFVMPMWIASGVFFSTQRFPEALRPVIRALPLTASVDALRANMLQGASLSGVAPQLVILAAWMVVCFGLALRLFRWR